MKNLKRIICLMAAVCLLVVIPAMETEAATTYTYQGWSSRGKQYIAYTKNTVNWNVKKGKNVSWDGYQSKSGVCVQTYGLSKMRTSTGSLYRIVCKVGFLVGAEYNGHKLGYSIRFNDVMNLKPNGSYTISWDN